MKDWDGFWNRSQILPRRKDLEIMDLQQEIHELKQRLYEAERTIAELRGEQDAYAG